MQRVCSITLSSAQLTFDGHGFESRRYNLRDDCHECDEVTLQESLSFQCWKMCLNGVLGFGVNREPIHVTLNACTCIRACVLTALYLFQKHTMKSLKWFTWKCIRRCSSFRALNHKDHRSRHESTFSNLVRIVNTRRT